MAPCWRTILAALTAAVASLVLRASGWSGYCVPLFTYRFRQSRPGLFRVDFNPTRWTIDANGRMGVKRLHGARDGFFAVTTGHPADRKQVLQNKFLAMGLAPKKFSASLRGVNHVCSRILSLAGKGLG